MNRWIGNPNVVRIIALVLSLLLWIVVHMEGRQQNTNVVTPAETSREIENVSIVMVGFDDQKFTLVSVEPREVKLRVVGSSSELRKITSQNFSVQLNLAGVVKGEQRVMLTPEGFSSRVDVEIIPASVLVTVEERLTKEMPVVVETTGNPATGFVTGTPIVQPNRVFVTVPESSMSGVASVKGQIDVDGADSNVKKQVKLVAYNEAGEIVDAVLDPSVVEAEVPISLPSKTVPLQIKLNGTPAAGFSLASFEQNLTEIVVYGDQQKLSGLELHDGVQTDITGLSESRTITVDIPVPAGFAKVEPSKVEVKINIVASVQRTFEDVQLVVPGIGQTYEAVIIEPQEQVLDVTLEGSPEVLSRLKSEDIDLIVDAGNLPIGTHQVTVSYSLPAYVRVVGEPAVVTVDIKEIVAVEQTQPLE
jgi:YbbR domain-containing protein